MSRPSKKILLFGVFRDLNKFEKYCTRPRVQCVGCFLER